MYFFTAEIDVKVLDFFFLLDFLMFTESTKTYVVITYMLSGHRHGKNTIAE